MFSKSRLINLATGIGIAMAFVLVVSTESTYGQNFPLPPTPPPHSNANARPIIAESMGVLNQALVYGSDGAWFGQAEGDAYRLNSRAEKGNIEYFWVGTKPEVEGRRQFGVNVSVDPNSNGSAGLIYGYQDNPKHYFLIMVDSARTLHVYEYSPDNFQEVLSSSTRGDGDVRLDILENGNEIQVFVDGRSVLSFSNNNVGRGGIGIAAMHAGSFLFSNFQLEIK